MFDSLHPNQVGYELIAGYAEAAMLNLPRAAGASASVLIETGPKL
jgi:hypothetical protein